MSLFKKNQSYVIIWAFMLIYTPLGWAKAYSKTELQNLAVQYLSEQLPKLTIGERELSALTLDSRTPDKECNSDLLVTTKQLQRSNRQSTVQIKCLDENKWNLYVRVRVKEYAPIITTTTNINKDQVITSENLAVTLKQKHLIRDHYLSEHDLPSLIGSRAKRNLRQDTPIGLKQICMVCEGDKVTILANFRGLSVKTSGLALQDGIIGQSISVKNSKSGKTLRVKVLGVDQVQVSI